MNNRTLNNHRVKPELVLHKDVTINVTNDFRPRNSWGHPYHHVRHVDTSGKPQFTAVVERVIGINESRRVYHNFIEAMLDDVPLRFQRHAKRLIFRYQAEISRMSSKRAILCDNRDSSGPLPSKAKPKIVRQERGKYIYNWFLAEYVTIGPHQAQRAQSERMKLRVRKGQEDCGYMSSHSVDFDSL